MIKKTYEFERGYAKPVNRGVVLWNGDRDEISAENPQRWVSDLVYEAIGAESIWSDGYNLNGVKVTIEIDEVAKQ